MKFIKTCRYCGHTGTDVNHFCREYVGGYGDIAYPCCDDAQACLNRIAERIAEKEEVNAKS